ncbi:hypothetical protein KIS4809_0448 [Bacillus sp. ZZV12-4809]|nr:hypothetical protein KIS4809_0448 [Bacillus sp. ZZV12-4809]
MPFIHDSYDGLIEIINLLIAMNLILWSIQEFRHNKKSLSAYCIVVMALLIIFLSIF